MSGVLLDTCAVIWLANGDRMARQALDTIVAAGNGEGIFVSPVSAWEIGLLASSRKSRTPLVFLPDAKTWFARVLVQPGIRSAPFTPAMAIDSASLPGELHGDPGDRLIASTARHGNWTLVTRDSRLIAYGEAGHLRVVPC